MPKNIPGVIFFYPVKKKTAAGYKIFEWVLNNLRVQGSKVLSLKVVKQVANNLLLAPGNWQLILYFLASSKKGVARNQ